MKTKLMYLLFAALLFTACKKETEKSLVGNWTASLMTADDDIDGTPLDLIAMDESMSMNFSECGTDGLCPVTVLLSLDGDIETFATHYVLHADGNSMAIVFTFEEEITIIEITDDKLTIRTPTFVYGNNFYAELDKG